MRASRLRRALSTSLELRRFGWQCASFNPLRPAPEPATPLERIYCGSIGAEFEHAHSAEEREWFASQLEAHLPAFQLSPSDYKNYHRLLASAECFEQFLSRKLATLKRYGGEGAEAQLPALHTLLAAVLADGASHAIVSSAHRGRLATQVSLLRYPARKLFWKLRGQDDIPSGHHGLDDVSSHVAVSTDLFVGRPWGSAVAPGPAAAAAADRIHVSLLPNPSHLEAVNPVAMGKARAMQDALRSQGAVASICIHGDAAVAGQGVVYETLALSASADYAVGGTLHLICNNQVGFTHATATAGAFARAAGFPILHVNAESPAHVVFACRLAAAYRAAFHKDAVVDLVGYRRNGHNEVDEPAFTNPGMYAGIRARASHTQALGQQLERAGVLSAAERDRHSAAVVAHLEREWEASEPGRQGGFSAALGSMGSSGSVSGDGAAFAQGCGAWGGFRVAETDEEVGASPATGVGLEALRAVGRASVALPPPPFQVHPRLLKGHIAPRLEALEAGKEDSVRGKLACALRSARARGQSLPRPHSHTPPPRPPFSPQPTIDWATAEALAFGTLLLEQIPVRLAGQDSQRGTFSHRHAVLHCQSPAGAAADARHTPLARLPRAAPFTPVSSPLTEFAALGFELGYSWQDPRSLVLWEAQFGDFANCAQAVIDTFVAGGESKWLRSSGLVLLLPHGQDGAGPEHSSARIERFLQLCNSAAWAAPAAAGQWPGDKTTREPINMLVCQPTTPANYFHALRRQASPHRPFRKPLVLATPKQLLRAPAAQSPLAALGPGTAFEPVLCAPAPAPAPPQRLILCSGKVYYELVARREALGRAGHASAPRTLIVRLEQLCPFPQQRLGEVLAAAGLGQPGQCTAAAWVQEEPANAGCWAWVQAHWRGALEGRVGQRLEYVGRPALAAPAVGLSAAWRRQQENVLEAAFA